MPENDALVLSRTFDAPRRLVWEAWTGAEHAFDGKFGEIEPHERLTFEGTLSDGNQVSTVVTFADEGRGKTRLSVRQTYSLESQATRGAQQGWTATLDQLAEYVRAGLTSG
jgi:uncharacterized protein YndB with AHSA1/START domain